MKLKHFLCAVVATTVLVTSAIGSAFAENDTKSISAQKETAATASQYVVTEDTVAALGLENPCFVSKEGDVEIEEGVLIDLILPKELNEKDLTSIAAKSFAGCPYIRSVVVPETILEIGEDAFADCEFLETIYVFGHQEDDLTLGEDWNGGADVVYIAEEAPALKSISVTKAPDKVDYVVGETFDDAGMEVSASYADGSTKVIDDYVIENANGLTEDTTSIKISYADGDVTKSCTVDVTVQAVASTGGGDDAGEPAQNEDPVEEETSSNDSEQVNEPGKAIEEKTEEVNVPDKQGNDGSEGNASEEENVPLEENNASGQTESGNESNNANSEAAPQSDEGVDTQSSNGVDTPEDIEADA